MNNEIMLRIIIISMGIITVVVIPFLVIWIYIYFTKPKKKKIDPKLLLTILDGLSKPDFTESIYSNLSLLFMRYMSVWSNDRLLRSKSDIDNNNLGLQSILDGHKKTGMIAEFLNQLSPILISSLKFVFKDEAAIINAISDLYDAYARHLGATKSKILTKLLKERMFAENKRDIMSTEELENLNDNTIIIDTLIKVVERDIMGYSGAKYYTYDLGEYPFSDF